MRKMLAAQQEKTTKEEKARARERERERERKSSGKREIKKKVSAQRMSTVVPFLLDVVLSISTSEALRVELL